MDIGYEEYKKVTTMGIDIERLKATGISYERDVPRALQHSLLVWALYKVGLSRTNAMKFLAEYSRDYWHPEKVGIKEATVRSNCEREQGLSAEEHETLLQDTTLLRRHLLARYPDYSPYIESKMS